MKRFLVLIATCGLVSVTLGATQFSIGGNPPDGSVKGLANVLAWVPQDARDAYADAGVSFTQVGPYVLFRARAWFDPATGNVGFPRLPDSVTVLRARRAGAGCNDATLCVADDPKALDPVNELQLDCACSSGSQCVTYVQDGGVYSDGGTRFMAAPQGQTLDVFAGSGCVRKSCVELWTSGGSSWPAACPCPSALPDGGGGC